MDETVKPPNTLWLVEVDDVLKPVSESAWQDPWTMLLTVPDVVVLPDRVTLEYEGPSADLRITWEKQWEPWGPIVSLELPPVYTTRTFSTGPGQQNDVDVSNVNILFIHCGANDIVIGGFVGGVNGQVLHVTKTCIAAHDVTMKHIAGSGNQDIYLHAGGDETLRGEYGGWTLACDGSSWYDISHAKHV
ncbi:hypothetical protein ES703_101095 [subsurface metagenome]